MSRLVMATAARLRRLFASLWRDPDRERAGVVAPPDPANGRPAGNGHLRTLGLCVSGLAVVAIACHGTGHHVGTVHTNADEQVCYEMETNEVTLEFAIDAVGPVLDSLFGWESRPKVNFTHLVNQQCSESNQREIYELEVLVYDGGTYDGCMPQAPCFLSPMENHPDSEPHGNHFNYTKGKMIISVDELDGSSQAEFGSLEHVVNHEAGHLLGLADPVSNPSGNGWDRCMKFYQGQKQWIKSIMHNKKHCEDFVTPAPDAFDIFNMPFPSTMDMNSVDEVGDQ